MAALREIFAEFGIKFDEPAMRAANSSVDKLKAGLEGVAAVFVGSQVFAGLGNFAAQLDVFDDLSAQTKIATDQLQFLGYAAKVNGSSQDEMFASLTRLQMAIGRTEKATSPQAAALKKMGVALEDAAGQERALRDILPEVFANFSSLESEQEKAAAATALFGRAGVRMIPVLDRGVEGMAALNEEFQKFGGPVSEEAIKAAGEYRDNIVRLDTAWFKLKGMLASSALPAVSSTTERVARGVAALAEWTKNTTLADSATAALAGTIGLKLGAALLPYLGTGLKFAGLYLAFDDLVAFLTGKQSVIGDLLDTIFGDGTGEQVQRQIAVWKNHFTIFFDDLNNHPETFKRNWNRTIVDIGADLKIGLDKSDAEYGSFIASLVRWNEVFFDSLFSIPEKIGDAFKATLDAVVPDFAKDWLGGAGGGGAAPKRGTPGNRDPESDATPAQLEEYRRAGLEAGRKIREQEAAAGPDVRMPAGTGPLRDPAAALGTAKPFRFDLANGGAAAYAPLPPIGPAIQGPSTNVTNVTNLNVTAPDQRSLVRTIEGVIDQKNRQAEQALRSVR